MQPPDGQEITGIGEVFLHRYALPYHRPVRWAGGGEDSAEFLLLRLRTRDGREGAAEVVAKPTWNGFDGATMAFAFERLVLPLLGLSPEARAQGLSRLVEMHAPKAFLENALADLAHPASDSKRRIPVSITLTRAAPEAMAGEAREQIAMHGFGTFKVKGGQGLATDIAAVQAVREAAGGDAAIYVDVNAGLTCEETASYMSEMAKVGVIAVEDPYNLKPDPRLTEIARSSAIPLITDFSLDGVSSATAFLSLGATGLSIKVSRFGLRKALLMADLAAKASAVIVAGLFGESQAGALHVLDLHAGLPTDARVLPAEATSFLLMRDHVLKAPLSISGGHIERPEGNLAALLDHERIERFAVAPTRKWTIPA